MIVLSEKNIPTLSILLNDCTMLPMDEEEFYSMNLVNIPDQDGEEPFEDIEEYFL